MTRAQMYDYENGTLECELCDSVDMSPCEGVEGKPCDNYACATCDDEGRCNHCQGELTAEREKATWGFRLAPVVESECGVCMNDVHRHNLPAVYCKSCYEPVCADCLVWDDVCEDCSRAWKRLRMEKI